jgi:anti-sigma regulatory factor (Ser/Thr protein kinase)
LARDGLNPLLGRLGETTFEKLRLLVTELVTNAVRHAGLKRDQRIRVQVQLVEGAVRAEVREPGRGFEPPAPPTPGHDGGWGLFLVDRLASAWSVMRDGETIVWFELEA